MTDSTRSPTAADAQTDTHTAAAGSPTADDDPVVLLHVEPDARSAELLTTFAERFVGGFAVRSVGGTTAALDQIDAVDCVVTEQLLPNGSGVELVERIRGRDVDVPVVFHTTCREDEAKARALEAGADAYFEKRSARGRYERILDRVRELVGGRDSHRSNPADPVSVDDSSGTPETIRSEE